MSTLNSDSMNELLRELAVQHHVVIGRDDPIMMLTTIQHHMLKKLLESQQEALTEFQSRMEQMITSWSEDSRGKAQRIVNASLDASKRMLTENTEVISNAIAVEVGKMFDRRVSETERMMVEIRAEKKANYLLAVGFSGFALLMAVASFLLK